MFAQRIHAESHAFPFGPDIYIPIDGKACLIGAAHITKADTDGRCIYLDRQLFGLNAVITCRTNMCPILHTTGFCPIGDGQRMISCLDSKALRCFDPGFPLHGNGDILIHDILAIFFSDTSIHPCLIQISGDRLVKVCRISWFFICVRTLARLRKGDIPCLYRLGRSCKSRSQSDAPFQAAIISSISQFLCQSIQDLRIVTFSCVSAVFCDQ